MQNLWGKINLTFKIKIDILILKHFGKVAAGNNAAQRNCVGVI